MKVLVPVKRVIDFNVKIRVSPDGSGVESFNAKMSMNPFDEISVEAAVRLKEAGIADEVVAVSIGPAKAEDTLRQALAMGAGRAVLIETDRPVEPLAVAKLLARAVAQEGADLVIAGKQAIDDDCHQTGQMLAGLLGWAQASAISSLTIADGHAEVTEEVDGGLQNVQLKLPAVVTTDLRLNEPRFASLPNMMKARQKPLDKRTPEEFGVDISPRLEIVSTAAPPARKAGVIVASVDELVARLRDEAELV